MCVVPEIPATQIYAAFDPRSFSLFHAAIRRSRDGVVRAADLRYALATQAADCCPGPIPPSWQPEADSQGEHVPWRSPVSNEPELRAILQSAYRLAVEASRGRGAIIRPQELWAAALPPRPTVSSSGSQPADRQRAYAGAPVGDLEGAPHGAETKRWTAEAAQQVMAGIFQDWMAMQTEPRDACRVAMQKQISHRIQDFAKVIVP
jgi:hypothetical protein